MYDTKINSNRKFTFNIIFSLMLFCDFCWSLEPASQTCSRALTIITRVNSLGQQEAAELVFSMHRVLDLHQVGRHAERIVLQVALTLLTTTGDSWEENMNETKM